MKTELVQHYEIIDGKPVLIKEEQVEIYRPTIEDKEAELLALYQEIQAMKASQE